MCVYMIVNVCKYFDMFVYVSICMQLLPIAWKCLYMFGNVFLNTWICWKPYLKVRVFGSIGIHIGSIGSVFFGGWLWNSICRASSQLLPSLVIET